MKLINISYVGISENTNQISFKYSEDFFKYIEELEKQICIIEKLKSYDVLVFATITSGVTNFYFYLDGVFYIC